MICKIKRKRVFIITSCTFYLHSKWFDPFLVRRFQSVHVLWWIFISYEIIDMGILNALLSGNLKIINLCLKYVFFIFLLYLFLVNLPISALKTYNVVFRISYFKIQSNPIPKSSVFHFQWGVLKVKKVIV